MEKNSNPSTLQQKLQLLRCLREGKLEHSEKILSNLSKTSGSNQHVYQSFHSFLSQHRQQIQETEKEERQLQQKVLIVDGGDEDDWQTDDDVSLSSKQQEKDEVKQQEDMHPLLKNISNSKSSALIHTLKDYKKPFLIQTKPKQIKQSKAITNYSLKSRKSAPKLQIQNKSLITSISKTTLVTKTLQKHSKPYFPPINGSKSNLKLVIK